MFKMRYLYTPKPKRFSIKPRFHDPEKEEREALIQALEQKHRSQEKMSTKDKVSFSMMEARRQATSARSKARSWRMLFIITLLLGITIYFLYVK